MAKNKFSDVLVENADFLKPFAINLTRDNDAANDLYQETLYKALANQEKYNTGTNLKAWLFTIMRNIFINDYRKKSRQRTVLDTTPNEVLINQRQLSIRNQAESILRTKEINEAIQQLPALFKIPFELYNDGYKYQEIADLLGEPLGTVKSRIHFARKLLKERIERF